eukprot:CAMPEP_0118895930 /NCGR_PEP_ID=MMETSP1166-20130328/4045_1 /TAXON_ID=1104430 /ORGANISM="Chrysoreinhardia sp, Strain CCMP3193" /LENGTH=506 /DNA_ID=CAMNT_0006834981 /DNA_START=133 /DNA_END=1653 /DNA_ORIENTATION=+
MYHHGGRGQEAMMYQQQQQQQQHHQGARPPYRAAPPPQQQPHQAGGFQPMVYSGAPQPQQQMYAPSVGIQMRTPSGALRPPIDPSTGHDYRRGDDGSVHVDLARVHHLLAKRLACKMSRSYDEADRVRQELRDVGVEVQDKLKIWTARPPDTTTTTTTRFAPGVVYQQQPPPLPPQQQQPRMPPHGQAQPPRDMQRTSAASRPSTRGLIDPTTGHDYRRHDGDSALADVAAIDALIARRLQCKMSGQYRDADTVRERLRAEHGVEVQDRDKLWRVVQIHPAAAAQAQAQAADAGDADAALAKAAATAKQLSAQLQKRPRSDDDKAKPLKAPKVLGGGESSEHATPDVQPSLDDEEDDDDGEQKPSLEEHDITDGGDDVLPDDDGPPGATNPLGGELDHPGLEEGLEGLEEPAEEKKPGLGLDENEDVVPPQTAVEPPEEPSPEEEDDREQGGEHDDDDQGGETENDDDDDEEENDEENDDEDLEEDETAVAAAAPEQETNADGERP